MSYCRFGDDSDVYSYPGGTLADGLAYYCDRCSLSGNEWNWECPTPEGLFWHLVTHRLVGHRVPPSAFEELYREATEVDEAGE